MRFFKKIILYAVLYIFFIILLLITFNFKNKASTTTIGIESFPDSYKPYLEELRKKHPNWTFKALYTNLEWNYVIEKESKFGVNLVPKNYSDTWKNTTKGQYNVEVDSGWVDSSKRAVEYCMDPRNFLNETRIFQFEALSYESRTNNLDGIEKILYGTELYNTKVSYFTSSGKTVNMNEKYSDLILKAGQTSLVSPYHLASRIKQEVGPFLTHDSISGKVVGYEGLYNFYNIGATSSTETLGAIRNGLQYAKDGKGASEATKTKYLIPWNTKEKAIIGGAIFIGSSYINVGQNTIYLQKFDVNDTRSNSLFSHQYMTNVLAPYTESKSIYSGYSNSGLLNTVMTFIIPVYNNMPQLATDSPNINLSTFSADNTRMYCNAQSVNVRTGPSTSYEVITTIAKNTEMTRILKGKQSGERWDKVTLDNGITGYIYQTYITEMPEAKIENIEVSLDSNTLKKGETKSLNIKITPEEASKHKVIFSSSNTSVATVDDKGLIKAIRSGKATITVKAKENNVETSINIIVYSPVTKISLEQSEIYMSVGDNFQINAIIEPNDADNKLVAYTSSNEEIASIDEDGIITAKQEGNVILTISSNENPEIKAECNLNIVRKVEESELQIDDSLTLNSIEISGIDYKENTVLDVKNKIITDLDVEVVNYEGETQRDEDIVSTGYKILIKENDNILRQYQIIIYGDVNGDGKINSVDLLVLQRHILKIKLLDPIFKKAANIRRDGSNPTSVDLLLIQRHILKLKEIEQ